MNVFGEFLDESKEFLEKIGQDVLDTVDRNIEEQVELRSGQVIGVAAQQPAVQRAAFTFAFDNVVLPLLIIIGIILIVK